MTATATDGLYRRVLRFARRVLRGGTRRVLRKLGLLPPPPSPYEHWMRQRLRDRREEYSATPRPGLFSILTPVFNPPPRFLEELARSVFAQDYPEFEWVIVDNGNGDRRILRALKRISGDPRVRILSFAHNLGIAAGTRQALLHAHNRFVLTVDHDDVLYPDALRVVAAYVEHFPDAKLFYSDEDKLVNGRADAPFFKPDWDPVLFTNCCYPAHLMALDRQLALDFGAYSDPQVEGAQDWDAFARLVEAGHSPVHIPEILYSWRIHAASTASAESEAKPYTVAAQQRVIRRFVASAPAPDKVEVRANPLYGRAGMWRLARRPEPFAPPLTVLLLTSGNQAHWLQALHALAETSYPDLRLQVIAPAAPTPACGQVETGHGKLTWEWLPGVGLASPSVRAAAKELDDHDLVAVLHDDLLPETADWAWEALGLFEQFPDAAAVGGKVVCADGSVWSAGEVFGMDGLTGCPYRGQSSEAFGIYGGLICQRSVSALDGGFFVARTGFLRELLEERSSMARALLGAWLGVLARRNGRRLVLSPHIVARTRLNWRPPAASSQETLDFLRRHAAMLSDDPLYSPFLALNYAYGYHIALPHERAAALQRTLSQLAGETGSMHDLLPPRKRYAAVRRLGATRQEVGRETKPPCLPKPETATTRCGL